MRFIILTLLLIPITLMGENYLKSFDIAIIKSHNFPSLQGLSVEKLSLFRIMKGKLKEIPFQVDRVNRDGTYSLKKVKAIGENDEVVFQMEDAGEENDEVISSHFPGKCIFKITVSENGEKGWVYFVYPLRHHINTRYVKYKHYGNLETISTPLYSASYRNQSIFFSSYRVKKRAGGNDRNIIDTMKLRFVIKTFLGITFKRTERDLTYRVIGVKAGPVRVIRKTSSRLKVFLGLKSPAILVDNYYTKYYLETPSYLTVPFKLSYVAKKAYYRQTISYTGEILGSRLFCNGCRKPLIFDGKMEDYEKETKVEPLFWSAIIGKAGYLVYLAKWSKDLPVTKNLYFYDDTNATDPLEKFPGVYEFGYLIGDAIRLKPKKYNFSLSIFALPEWSKQNLQLAIDANNNEPAVNVVKLTACTD